LSVFIRNLGTLLLCLQKLGIDLTDCVLMLVTEGSDFCLVVSLQFIADFLVALCHFSDNFLEFDNHLLALLKFLFVFFLLIEKQSLELSLLVMVLVNNNIRLTLELRQLLLQLPDLLAERLL